MLSDVAVPLMSALVLGSAHALEPDHLAAVSSFVVRRPTPRAALGFGVRWAAGHGAVILIVGTLLVVLGMQLPESVGVFFERLAGAMLLGLGVWTAASARAVHAHRHSHDDGTVHVHVHSHQLQKTPHHHHGHGVTAVGAMHGLAGTAPIVALLPLAGFHSAGVATMYLLLFAIGTAAGMGFYALLAGWVAGTAALKSQTLARGITLCTGLFTAGIGIFWLLR